MGGLEGHQRKAAKPQMQSLNEDGATLSGSSDYSSMQSLARAQSSRLGTGCMRSALHLGPALTHLGDGLGLSEQQLR